MEVFYRESYLTDKLIIRKKKIVLLHFPMKPICFHRQNKKFIWALYVLLYGIVFWIFYHVHVLNNVRSIKRLSFLMDFSNFLSCFYRCWGSFIILWTRNWRTRLITTTGRGVLRFGRFTVFRRFRVLMCLFASFPFHSSILKPYFHL